MMFCHNRRRQIITIIAILLAHSIFAINSSSIQAQVPEGEKETLPGFLDGLDYLTHPIALRAIAEHIIKSGTPDGVIAALDKTLSGMPAEDALYCWGRTFESLIESSRDRIDAAEARLSDATRVHAPTGALRS